MPQQQNQNDVAVPSVNIQVLAGVFLVSFWMLNTDRKLTAIMKNQKIIAEQNSVLAGMIGTARAEATMVKDVIRLAAANTIENKGA